MAKKPNPVDVAPAPKSVTKNPGAVSDPGNQAKDGEEIESIQKIAAKNNRRMWRVA